MPIRTCASPRLLNVDRRLNDLPRNRHAGRNVRPDIARDCVADCTRERHRIRVGSHEPSVSFDAVAKNLRDVAPKMREKYGKPVDFEVVLKDGKVGLKPVPKG